MYEKQSLDGGKWVHCINLPAFQNVQSHFQSFIHLFMTFSANLYAAYKFVQPVQ